MPPLPKTTSITPGIPTLPDVSSIGVWGDDGYEWLEHPVNSGEWYWRNPTDRRWMKH
jgi:hypothetical protein